MLIIDCTNKGRVKFVLQKPLEKSACQSHTLHFEITKLGIRRTPKINSKNPTWKVRAGWGQALQSMTSQSQSTMAMHQRLILLQYWDSHPFIYYSCHAKACLYPTQPYKYIIECVYIYYYNTSLDLHEIHWRILVSTWSIA